jgi:hypothetical protein
MSDYLNFLQQREDSAPRLAYGVSYCEATPRPPHRLRFASKGLKRSSRLEDSRCSECFITANGFRNVERRTILDKASLAD